MKSRHRKSADAPDESEPVPDCDPEPAKTPALRDAGRQLAICKSELRPETADRYAIERAENEGMTVRAAQTNA